MGRGGDGVMGFRLVKGPAGEAQLTSRKTIRLRDGPGGAIAGCRYRGRPSATPTHPHACQST